MESPETFTLPLIPELLRLICENIERKSTLAVLARTCKAFEHHALDVLWSDLEGFYPLAKCLPSHLWAEVIREDTTSIVLRCPLISGDCERLLRYAGKVHKFVYRQGTWYKKQKIDNTVLQGIQLALQGAKLMPNIQSLTWTSDKDDKLPFVHMFMGPRLHSVEFSFRGKSTVPISLFPTLCQQYPLLKCVLFTLPSIASDNENEKEAIRVISHSLSNPQTWQSLEHLHVPNVTDDALLRLSHMPTLRKLKLQRWVPNAATSSVLSGGFPALEVLSLRVMNAPDLIPLLKMMNSTPMKTISVMVLKTQEASDYKRLFTAISEHCRHDTLEWFDTNDGAWDKEVANLPLGDPVNFKSIKPMLAFRNLKHFGLQLTRGCYFSDPSSTKEMATAWTKIEHLEFEMAFTRRSQMESTITLADLVPFAQHCPSLRYLAIPFNATDPPEIDDDKPGSGVSQTSLTQLYVLDSPAKFHINIAAFLSSCFPQLETIETVETREVGSTDEREEDEIGQREKTWKDVDNYLWAFSAIRRQERLSLA